MSDQQNQDAQAARLQEIRARIQATTPGPWRLGAEDNGWWVQSAHGYAVAMAFHYADDEDSDALPNATFIAHAPADVSWLLSVVEELQRTEPAGTPPGDAGLRDDARIMARFITGYWPGLEDGIAWGTKESQDAHPAYQAALRVQAALAQGEGASE